MKSELPFTGERFVPGTKGEIWIEHWHRYHFAARWARGKRVLDVACGEGYGSALLARTAAHVTGVDLSEQAIGHAKKAYASLANVEFMRAPCTQLPVADASIDVAVTFETLEHIAEQDAFLDELARVLAPGGVLVLSCPNKLEYSDKRSFSNEFHVKELYRAELEKLVAARFPHADWYGQRPTFFSLIAPEQDLPPGEGPGKGSVQPQLVEVSESSPDRPSSTLSNPLYFIVVAGRDPAALAETAPALSVLADRDDWVHRDYEKVMGYLERSAKHAEGLEQQLGHRDQSIRELSDGIRGLQDALAQHQAAMAELKALAETAAANHRADMAARDAEIARRRGWRWWLKLPLIRLGILK